jgi:hypothetical protein
MTNAANTQDELGRCETCGVGHFVADARPGRRVLYRRGLWIELPADLVVPTCNHCGEMLTDEDYARVVTELGRAAYGSPPIAKAR